MDVGTVWAELSELNKHSSDSIYEYSKFAKTHPKGDPWTSGFSKFRSQESNNNISDESLCFKGYHLYQEVCPKRIFKALDFLKKKGIHTLQVSHFYPIINIGI